MTDDAGISGDGFCEHRSCEVSVEYLLLCSSYQRPQCQPHSNSPPPDPESPTGAGRPHRVETADENGNVFSVSNGIPGDRINVPDIIVRLEPLTEMAPSHRTSGFRNRQERQRAPTAVVSSPMSLRDYAITFEDFRCVRGAFRPGNARAGPFSGPVWTCQHCPDRMPHPHCRRAHAGLNRPNVLKQALCLPIMTCYCPWPQAG